MVYTIFKSNRTQIISVLVMSIIILSSTLVPFNKIPAASATSITKDTSGVSTFGNTGTSYTSSSFTIGTNNDRILIVGVSDYAYGGTVADFSTVTLDGTTLTQLTGSDGASSGTYADRSAIYYLINPPTGSHTITMTTSSSVSGGGIGWISLYNVDQTTGIQSGNTNHGIGGQVSVVITPTVTGSWIVAHSDTLSSPNPGSPTSPAVDDWDSTPNEFLHGQHITSPTINSAYTMSWQTTTGNNWSASGAEVCLVGSSCGGNGGGGSNGTGIISINGDTNHTQIIQGVGGSTTVSTSTGTTTIGLASTITNPEVLNALTLGGYLNANAFSITNTGDIKINSGNKLYLDGGSSNYITYDNVNNIFKIIPSTNTTICIGIGC